MTPAALRLKQLLGLTPNIDRFVVVTGTAKRDGHIVGLSTRRLLSGINYLSQGIDVPWRDIAAARICQTLQPGGKTPFDWQDRPGDVFHVR